MVILSDGRPAPYHDGFWAAGRGDRERRVGDIYVSWNPSESHSFQARAGDILFGAVRTLPTIVAAVKGMHSDYVPLAQVPFASFAKKARFFEVGLLTALAGISTI